MLIYMENSLMIIYGQNPLVSVAAKLLCELEGRAAEFSYHTKQVAPKLESVRTPCTGRH